MDNLHVQQILVNSLFGITVGLVKRSRQQVFLILRCW